MKKVILKTQQQRVLELLWEKKGSNNLAREMGFTPSLLNVWKRKCGKVPLIHVGHVSRHLKVSPYLLNYLDVKYFFNKAPAWKEILIDAKENNIFSRSELEYILKGESPK